jgi:superfamily I DNA and RNA helicase
MEPHWGGAKRVYNASTGYDELQNFVEVVLQPPVDSIGRLTSAPHQLVHFG